MDFQPDTSSYPKPPALPAQQPLLDQVGKYQQLQSNQIGIQKQQLDLMNQHFQLMNNDLSTLLDDPSTIKDDVAARMTARMKTFNSPPELINQMNDELQKAPDAKTFLTNTMVRGMNTNERINKIYGQPGYIQNGQTVQPILTRTGQGPTAAGAPIQMQVPPSTSVIDPDSGAPKLLGPQAAQAAPGAVTAPPAALPVGPINPAGIQGPSSNFGGNVTGATVSPNQTVQNRFPSSLPTGLPPGVAEARTAAGGPSGTQLANDRLEASHFQRDVFPLSQAIPDLEKLGPKGTGPGTDTINHLKSFILSNVPGINKDDPAFASVPTYDKAKKYLTDFVNQTGNSGTNDKLAAAFAGNPSVGISNAAAVDVAKSALALRRMKQAVVLNFENNDGKPEEYSSYVTKQMNQLDPRAFGVDMMNDNAKQKLLTQLNKNPKEKANFENSLKLAHDLNFVTPSQQ